MCPKCGFTIMRFGKVNGERNRRVGSVGLGGLQPPYNLLKLVDFVSEKAVKRKVMEMTIQLIYHRQSHTNLSSNAHFQCDLTHKQSISL